MGQPFVKSVGAAVLAVVLLAALVQVNPLVAADDPPPGFHTSRLNVGFFSGIPSNVTSRVDNEGGVLVQTVLDLNMITVKTKSGVSQETLMTRLAAYPDTQYVVRDIIGTWNFVPNDTLYDDEQQNNLDETNIESAWNDELGDTSVVIGVIDSGIHCLHEDFRPTLLTTRCDSRNANTLDAYGHGTYVAGVAAAITNNLKGIAGVSQSTLFPLTIATQSMEFVLSDVVFQIMQAISLELDVLVMSGTFQVDCDDYPNDPGPCTPLKWAVENATEVMVFAASVGNNNADCPPPFTDEGYVGFPAAYPQVIGVGGSSDLGRWATNAEQGSNCGPEVDILAPASDIMSTIPEVNGLGGCGAVKYCAGSGTSASAPYVAGVAALILAKCPNMAPEDVVDLIQDEALPLDLEPEEQGHGLVQVDASLEAAIC